MFIQSGIPNHFGTYGLYNTSYMAEITTTKKPELKYWQRVDGEYMVAYYYNNGEDYDYLYCGTIEECNAALAQIESALREDYTLHTVQHVKMVETTKDDS